MSYYTINTFDDVAKHYAETKPIVSNLHPLEQDIRPIAARRRKWDRIVKVSDTQYGLTDGYYSDMWHKDVPEEFVSGMLPILWERRADGDYIRVRTVTEGHTTHTRLKFLSWFLPRGLTVSGRNGKMFIHTKADGKEHYLPKTSFRYDYSNKTMTEDDGMCLWFKHTGDAKFERANSIVAMSDLVDTELKKRLKPHIQSFFDWACAIRLMLDHSWDARRSYRAQMDEWLAENDEEYQTGAYRGLMYVNKKHLRDAIVAKEHPLKLPMAMEMYNDVGLVYKYHGTAVEVQSEEQLRKIKASYNRWITKVLGLYKQETF